MAIAYDADSTSKARTGREVRIGGKKFFPRKKTASLIKALIALDIEDVEETKRLQDTLDDGGPESTGAQLALAERGIENVYRQVAMLLCDPEKERVVGNPEADMPDVEWLMEELDLEDARNVYRELMPDEAAEGNAGGGE